MVGNFIRSTARCGATLVLTLATLSWAAPFGAAHSLCLFVSGSISNSIATSSTLPPPQRSSRLQIPRPAYFREVPGRGLLVALWINGRGPYNFVIDTGAGATIVSSRVATEANLSVMPNRSNKIAGLSGILSTTTATEAKLKSIAIGDRDNFLPATGTVLVADIFPRDSDGLLDPTDSYWPRG